MIAKLRGVWLQDDLGFRKHIDYVMHICNQRTYLLTQFKRQGLPIAQMLEYCTQPRPGVDI